MNEARLTKYTPGGIRELLTISWPIMLSTASGSLMVFIDRLILSYYSPEAFDAIFGVMHWYWTFSATIMAFVLIAEVFIGQNNGAQRHREIGPIVWQMIWFCCALYGIFTPIALWLTPFIVADKVAKLGVPYLTIIILGIPINCIGTGALASFFVGRGKTKIIPLVTLVFNALNIILDFLLIWGCRVTPGGQLEIISGHGLSIPWLSNHSGLTLIPEMGIIGAGMATIIAQLLSTLLLLGIFFRKSHRERYDTGNWALNLDLMKKCLKAGFPNMLSHLVTLVSLTLMTQAIIILTTPDDTHAYGIIHTIYCSISFICEGMAAGVRTVCSNAFGARKFDVIHKNIRSFLIICAVLTIGTSIGAVFFPDSLMSIFPEKMLGGNIHDMVRYMLFWIWLVFTLDTLTNCLMNLLLALGDVKITPRIFTFSFLFVAILPSYIGIAYFGRKSVFFWQFIALHYVVCLILHTIRYRGKRLEQMKLI